MKDDRLYLDHILERIRLIQAFTVDGHDEFIRSVLIQEAVIRCFEIIGEAAGKVSESLRSQYTHIPWSKIVSFRNRLIHGYDFIDLERVWLVVENDLSDLKTAIEDLLEMLDKSND
jgi:uncharacterized protein with HEPN domain